MAMQVVCNECGAPIDTTQEYVSGTVQAVKPGNESPNPMMAMVMPVRFDFHIEHVPEALKQEAE